MKNKNFSSMKILYMVGSVLLVIAILVSLPRLSMQIRFDNSQDDFIIMHPSELKLYVSTWNRAGVISGIHIITPESCISASISDNLTCTHNTKTGTRPCNIAACGPTKAQDTTSEDILHIKIDDKNKPKNFTISLISKSYVGPIPIKTLEESYNCNLKNWASYSCLS